MCGELAILAEPAFPSHGAILSSCPYQQACASSKIFRRLVTLAATMIGSHLLLYIAHWRRGNFSVCAVCMRMYVIMTCEICLQILFFLQ